MQPIKIIVVALALMFAGCGKGPTYLPLPTSDSGGADSGPALDSGESGSASGTSGAGSGRPGSGGGSGAAASSEDSSGSSTGAADDGSDTAGTCLWGGEVCFCDGQPAADAWCEGIPYCVIELIDCICGGFLSEDPLADCVRGVCEEVGRECMCDGQPVEPEWCDL